MTKATKQPKTYYIKRYNISTRITHWIVAASFCVLGLSGLALFYPTFSWFAQVFGTLETARIVHPFVGVVMFLGFLLLFIHGAKRNIINQEDVKWALAVRKVLVGEEVGDIGKFNGGQKVMFWVMTICLLVLLITGIMLWQSPFYFASHFSIPARRIAVLLHASAAMALIASIIIHVYASFWVKGTFKAMIEGIVSVKWAKHNHPRWYREVMEKSAAATTPEQKSE